MRDTYFYCFHKPVTSAFSPILHPFEWFLLPLSHIPYSLFDIVTCYHVFLVKFIGDYKICLSFKFIFLALSPFFKQFLRTVYFLSFFSYERDVHIILRLRGYIPSGFCELP